MTLQTHSTLHDLAWRRADCGHGISSSLSRSFSLTLTFVHRRSSEVEEPRTPVVRIWFSPLRLRYIILLHPFTNFEVFEVF